MSTVSIRTPAYSDETTRDRPIGSVVAKALDNRDHLFDDGSTDGGFADDSEKCYIARNFELLAESRVLSMRAAAVIKKRLFRPTPGGHAAWNVRPANNSIGRK